ncbi:hypothetical protein FRB98_004502 [Tulasnella sp. 332]|nr:hypothetical protein FRB98_004502 [Tulasnella sp. 332]
MDCSPIHERPRLQQSQLHAHPHAHDIVFQQMVLRTAQALPVPPPALPLATIQLSVKIAGGRTATIKGKPMHRGGETDDEGYHADRDNARTPATQGTDQSNVATKRPLARVTCDFIVETSPPSASSVYCKICNVAIRPSTYRLRLIDSHFSSSSSASPVATMYHVHCFETNFDLEQPGAFGRIYPAPSSSPSSRNTHPGGLDDDARALVNAWKLQRRREGLESAAGPDSGIRITSSDSCSCSLGGQEDVFVSTSRKAGEKRSNRVVEAEAEERKRAKYYTSDDGYGPRGPNSLLRRATEVPSSLGNYLKAPSRTQ